MTLFDQVFEGANGRQRRDERRHDWERRGEGGGRRYYNA